MITIIILEDSRLNYQIRLQESYIACLNDISISIQVYNFLLIFYKSRTNYELQEKWNNQSQEKHQLFLQNLKSNFIFNIIIIKIILLLISLCIKIQTCNMCAVWIKLLLNYNYKLIMKLLKLHCRNVDFFGYHYCQSEVKPFQRNIRLILIIEHETSGIKQIENKFEISFCTNWNFHIFCRYFCFNGFQL